MTMTTEGLLFGVFQDWFDPQVLFKDSDQKSLIRGYFSGKVLVEENSEKPEYFKFSGFLEDRRGSSTIKGEITGHVMKFTKVYTENALKDQMEIYELTRQISGSYEGSWKNEDRAGRALCSISFSFDLNS